MIFIPAIDLRNNRVVRLTQGKYDQETVYDSDPLILAKSFVESGSKRIHIIDLEGARTGKPTEKTIINQLVNNLSIQIQIGGGIRSLESIEAYLSAGAHRVILGTKACMEPDFLTETLKEFPNQITISIDSKNGLVVTDGWTKITSIKTADFVKQVENLGGTEIIVTDIETDGMLKGPNIKAIAAVASSTQMNVIASGGISSLLDLKMLMELELPNITGVISGKAIYENKFTVAEAVAVLQC